MPAISVYDHINALRKLREIISNRRGKVTYGYRHGMCYYMNKIDWRLNKELEWRLCQLHMCTWVKYLAPLTDEGDLVRIQFIDEWIKEIQENEKAKN